MTTQELHMRDAQLVIHPICSVGQNMGVILDRAEGVKLWDTDGKEYLDFTSQLINVNLGHGRREIIQAISEQMKRLQYTTLFWGLSHTPVIKCAEKLAELVPQGMGHFQFTSGGSESTETSFKLARLYWSLQGKSKHKIISLYRSYHGCSLGAASATGISRFWSTVEPMPGFLHVPPYYCFRCPFRKEYPQCDVECANFLATVIETEGKETVAAFVGEPVMGSGGMIAPPPDYWPRVREICDHYEVLLIADEVMTGFGRTGKLFAVEHWGLSPDIMTLAKGISSGYIPFGAVALSEDIYEILKGNMLFHGHTYSGHPVGAAAAAKAMEIYTSEGIAEKAAIMGDNIMHRLEEEFLPLPHVGNVGGLGLMLGVEVVLNKQSKTMPDPSLMAKIQMDLIHKGVLTRYLVNRMMLCPPLTITEEEANRGLDVIYGFLKELRL